MFSAAEGTRRGEINVPFAAGRGDVLSSTLLLCADAGASFRLALPDASLEDAIVGN